MQHYESINTVKAAKLVKLLWGYLTRRRTTFSRMPQKLIEHFVGITDQGIRSRPERKVQVIIFEWFGKVKLIQEGTKLCPKCPVREHKRHTIA